MSNLTEQIGIRNAANDVDLVDIYQELFKGRFALKTQQLTATGAMNAKTGLLLLSHASVIIAATIPAPSAVGQLLAIVNNSASGTAAHTATLPSGVTWNGTNTIATLNAPDEALLVVATSLTRYFILANLGSVALSGP